MSQRIKVAGGISVLLVTTFLVSCSSEEARRARAVRVSPAVSDHVPSLPGGGGASFFQAPGPLLSGPATTAAEAPVGTESGVAQPGLPAKRAEHDFETFDEDGPGPLREVEPRRFAKRGGAEERYCETPNGIQIPCDPDTETEQPEDVMRCGHGLFKEEDERARRETVKREYDAWLLEQQARRRRTETAVGFPMLTAGFNDSGVSQELEGPQPRPVNYDISELRLEVEEEEAEEEIFEECCDEPGDCAWFVPGSDCFQPDC